MSSIGRTVRVANFIDAAELKKDMSYSLADLSTAMMEQSTLFARYGVLASKASKQVDDFKLLLEAAESQVYRKIRDEKAKAAEKVTEAQLEKEVAVHPRVVQFKRALNEARQVEGIAKTAVEGFRHRRDMLIQHGLITREEMKGEVSINRRNFAQAEQEVLAQRVLDLSQRHISE